jgi:hypothetical protein
MGSTLKATTAREITKESVTEAETLVVNGVSVSKAQGSPMQAGDFYFRPTVVQRTVRASWWQRLLRKSAQGGADIVNTIVISCPACGLPILTPPAHRITQRHPLTIEGQIACPYAPAGTAGGHAFLIKDGNIMPA